MGSMTELVEEYEELFQKQSREIQELKGQLVSVLTLAETLEQELNEEKMEHIHTKERLNRIKYESSEPREKRSQSYTTSEVSSYIGYPSSKPNIPTLEITPPTTGPNSPTQISPKGKKKSRRFLRKFGKSQTKMGKFSSNDDIIPPTSPPKSPRKSPRHSPRGGDVKREVVAGSPDSKLEAQKLDSSANIPVAMSDEQLKRELEVLLLLGESLQAELVKERKNHQTTKKQLQDSLTKLEEMKQKGNFNGVSGFISRRGKGAVNTNATSTSGQPKKEDNELREINLKESDQSLLHEIDKNSFSHNRTDIYDLKETVTDMIALVDYFLTTGDNS